VLDCIDDERKQAFEGCSRRIGENPLKRRCLVHANARSFDFVVDRVAVGNFAQDDSFEDRTAAMQCLKRCSTQNQTLVFSKGGILLRRRASGRATIWPLFPEPRSPLARIYVYEIWHECAWPQEDRQ
jgi:hypothetical protein